MEYPESWDWQALSRYFLNKAVEADTAFWASHKTAKYSRQAQECHDRALAEFAVYHHLWGKPFLRSKRCLVDELQTLLKEIEVDEKTYDPEQFLTHYRHLIHKLIDSYQYDETRVRLILN